MRMALPRLDASARYADYLRRLDARAVLDHYGVENDHDEVTDRGETEVIHSCLLDRVDRHHNNGDRNPSATCNLERRLYLCFAYWGGDLFHFIMKMEGKDSFEEILPIIGPFLAGAVPSTDAFVAEMESLLAQHGVVTASLPAYSERILSPWAYIHPYLAERGIDADTASRLQIGWREDDNRIIVPHFWRGKLVGWQSRAVPDRPGQWPGTADPLPKYKSTSGFPKSDTFYYDHSRDFPDYSADVLVVESPLSVIKATALGLDTPVLATFGAKISAAQTRMLSNFRSVTLWADPDPAGQLMERTVMRRLQTHARLRIVDPDPGRDLADCDTLDAVTAKIEDAQPAILRSLQEGYSHG
jgi:DNA primase